MSHHVFTILLGRKLYLAPIPDNAKNVLDISTRTRIWPLTLLMLFPQLNVLETDLSSIQPSWAPPSVIFEINDCCV